MLCCIHQTISGPLLLPGLGLHPHPYLFSHPQLNATLLPNIHPYPYFGHQNPYNAPGYAPFPYPYPYPQLPFLPPQIHPAFGYPTPVPQPIQPYPVPFPPALPAPVASEDDGADGSYVHDTAGDEAEAYVHDSSGDIALPYVHDTTGDVPKKKIMKKPQK